MNATTLRAALPALVLATLALVPHLGKAFTIDDTVFMRQAMHALADPLHPTAFDMVWRHVPERVSQHVPTGPVMAWLLVPAALADGSEPVAHLVQLALLGLAILATVSLAARLGADPAASAAAGVLLAAMPAVLGMAGTAMPDVPAMAFGAAGLERLVAWTQDRRMPQAVLAAVLLGVSALTRSHALLLVAVGAVLVAGTTDGALAWRERWRVLPLLAVPLVVVAVTVATRDPDHGSTGILDAAAFYSSFEAGRLASNAVAFPIHWVLAMAFAAPWVALRWRALAGARSTLVVLAAGGLLSAGALELAGRGSIPLAAIAGVGLLALWDATAEGIRRRDRVQVALALWLLVPLCSLPYVHLPPKYLLVSAPAAALLVARELAGRAPTLRWIVVGGTATLGVALGVAILRADAALGEVGRGAVRELVAPRVAAGQRVWFVGHWGFQWYAERAGGRHATLTPPHPAPGDRLVVSLASARSDHVLQMLGGMFPRMSRVAELQDSRPGGRVMSKTLGAGFYSNVAGYLPWAWGDGPIDVVFAFDL